MIFWDCNIKYRENSKWNVGHRHIGKLYYQKKVIKYKYFYQYIIYYLYLFGLEYTESVYFFSGGC